MLTADIQNRQGVSAESSFLVVRLGALGDVIHALPAVTALRATYPHARIGWAIENRWVELLCSHEAVCSSRSLQKPLVDCIHIVDTMAWRSDPFSHRTWKEALQALHDIRAEHYEVAIDFQGAIKSALIAQWSGAPVRIGFRQPREQVASVFYTSQVVPESQHIVEQNFFLVRALGVEADPKESPVELPVNRSVEIWCDHELQRLRINAGEFAILNPGAGWGAKRWPAERYGEVARGLAELGLKSVINSGPNEQDLARAVECASNGAARAINCAIGELIAITRRARLFVGGDTGPMHLAAALGVPIVGIFGPTDPRRNGPFATESIVLRNPDSVTSHSRKEQPECGMLGIGPEQVLAAARRLLSNSKWEMRVVSQEEDLLE